jgi:filamin
MGDVVDEGGLPLAVSVTGPHGESLPVKKIDNNDGTFSVSYTPLDEGNHHISLNLNGKPVAKSPYEITADFPSGLPYTTNCYAEGPGLTNDNDTSEPTHFTIHSVDKNGNPVKSPSNDFDVLIVNPNGDAIPPLSTDVKDDGSVVVVYHPTEPGDYVIDVVLHNHFNPLYYDHIKGSSFHVNVKRKNFFSVFIFFV